MEDWLKCQISPFIIFHENQKKIKYKVLNTLISVHLNNEATMLCCLLQETQDKLPADFVKTVNLFQKDYKLYTHR